MSTLTLELGAHVRYLDWTEGLDAPQLIRDSERLSGITGSLNLEDWGEKSLPFLLCHPFVDDFERLRARARLDDKVCAAYHLDAGRSYAADRSALMRRMRVIAHQLAPRVNAFVAYCELKSQLCLERNDFFYELYSRVEERVNSSRSAEETGLLMSLVCLVRDMYSVYL